MNSPANEHRRRSFVARVVLLIAFLATPLCGYGAIKALQSTSNDPRQWLPRGFAETDTYDWFEHHFGSDEFAVVSWPGFDLQDARAEQLADALADSRYFGEVRSGGRIIDELTAPPLRLSRDAAIARMRGILVGEQNQTSCLLLSTSAFGRDNRIAAVEAIEQLAKKSIGIEPQDLKLAGPTVDAAAIDAESRKLLFQLAGFSALVSFLIASARLRSVKMALIVLTIAIYATGLSLAVLYFSGGTMNLLMTMLPPLVYVLTISSAVHLANYYRDALNDSASSEPLIVALSHGWVPCTLAATTTAIGLASLLMSSIEPIQMFGLYAALGVLLGLATLFVLFPAAITCFRPAFQTQRQTDPERSPMIEAAVGIIDRRHRRLALGCLILMVAAAAGLPFIRSTVKLQDRFLASSDTIADYRWLEENVGPMVPMEVVLQFDADDQRDVVEQLWVVASVQSKIQSLEEPLATMSAVNLAPALPRGESVGAVVRRKVLSSPRTLARWAEANFLAEEQGRRLWRITVRANAIGDLDYGLFAERLRRRVEPMLKQTQTKAVFTGVIPLIYKAQRQLLEDLVRSFFAAFMVIAVVLVVVLRGLTAALLAMVPNLFPAIVVFGGISWTGIAVQIGSVMTASAALGIAVDDTVHFLTWFRRGRATQGSRIAAIRDAFDRCAGAMLHTTLICSGGLLVFAASSFVPILHFAWLMVLLLFAALVGDLVLLPSILAGALGRFFERSVAIDRESAAERAVNAQGTRQV